MTSGARRSSSDSAAMARRAGAPRAPRGAPSAPPARPVPAPDPGRRGGRRGALGARERRTAAGAGRRAPAGQGCRARDTVVAGLRVRSGPLLGHRRRLRRRSAPRSRSASSAACRATWWIPGSVAVVAFGRDHDVRRADRARPDLQPVHAAAAGADAQRRARSRPQGGRRRRAGLRHGRQQAHDRGERVRQRARAHEARRALRQPPRATSAATRRGSSSRTSSGTSATTTCRGG